MTLPVPAPEVDYTKTPTLYLVATSHLDTQWRWDIQEVIRDLIPATMQGNLALFEKFPHYTFSFEGSFRYQLMEEYYPEDFDRVKKAIADGRWNVCGASVDAGDVNCVSPESLVRHTLYGNGYFREKFDRTSYDVFLPDCFGFGWALPSVMVHCGLKGFSTQKLSWGSAYGTPFSVGVWQGVDGSRVTATVNPGSYVSTVDHDLSDDEGWSARIQKNGEATGLHLEYAYFGVGDRGGAPTDETVEWVEKSVTRTDGKQRVVAAPADLIHRQLTEEQRDKLPVWRNELVMTRHAIGCYTSQSLMKRWNRANERLAAAAEAACVTADWLGALPYPAERLKSAWTRFLWNQMHDILPGTSIPRAYEFAWNDEALAQKDFALCLANGAGALCRGLDTATAHPPVVVHNANSFPVTQSVVARVCYDDGAPDGVTAHGPDGEAVPTQSRRAGDKTLEVRFLASVPPTGAAVYEFRPGKSYPAAGTEMHASTTRLESDRLRVEIDAHGDVASVFDKELGRELLDAPVQLQLLADAPREWPAWEIDYWTFTSDPAHVVSGPPDVRVVEHGPARAAVEITRKGAGSTFRLRVSIERGSPRVDFDLQVDWRSRGRLLKAVFPTAAHTPKPEYDLGLGVIERTINRPELYEVPAQQWADLTDVSKEFGVAVLNDCKHGWDHPEPNVLRLSLVRTPGVFRDAQDPVAAHHGKEYGDQETMDLGPHRMAFALMGHAGDWRSGVRQQAAAFNQPLRAFCPPREAGPLGRSFSFLEIDSPQILATAFKKAEDGDGVIVRLQELWGRSAQGVGVSFATTIESAVEVDGQEDELGALEVQDGRLSLDFEPHRPRAVRVRLAAATNALDAPSAAPVALNHNINVVSFNGRRGDGDMDGEGRSYPGELLQGGKIEAGGVPFELGPLRDGANNAMLCAGETIELPEGDWNRVYILAASVERDREAEFLVDGKAHKVEVPEWTGKVARWISRLDDEEAYTSDEGAWGDGFVKPAEVAHTCTHRHAAKADADEPYVFCYLFRVALKVDGARRLTLPKDGAVRLFAVTVARNDNDASVPAGPLMDTWETLTSLD